MFNIDSRLFSCASLVHSDSIIDVGTDHCKLPIWMVKNNLIKNALACDINPYSVRKSIDNVKKYHLENKIKVVQSDGLLNIDIGFLDTIVIAGLGGKTIANILQECQSKLNKHFILQPTKSESFLHSFLSENGFNIDSESVVLFNGFSYVTISSTFTGQKYYTDPTFPFIGKIKPCINSIPYVEKQIRYLQKKIDGLKLMMIPTDKFEKIKEELILFLSECSL